MFHATWKRAKITPCDLKWKQQFKRTYRFMIRERNKKDAQSKEIDNFKIYPGIQRTHIKVVVSEG